MAGTATTASGQSNGRTTAQIRTAASRTTDSDSASGPPRAAVNGPDTWGPRAPASDGVDGAPAPLVSASERGVPGRAANAPAREVLTAPGMPWTSGLFRMGSSGR